MLILGLDPSLSCTGWGVIRSEGARITHIANGQVPTDPKASMAQRLGLLQASLAEVIAVHQPGRAAAEEIYVNKNAQTTLKLAQARGAVLATCGTAGLAVNEHAARLVKKAVVGTGAAEKAQVQAMQATPNVEWADGGIAPILVLQPAEDAAAPGGGPALKARLQDRVTLVEIANAGHALLPEQPERVRDTILGHIGAL